MAEPLYRVKRYRHTKYQFVVRAKTDGKWRRRYFETEAEAQAFAASENAKVGGGGNHAARGLADGAAVASSGHPVAHEDVDRLIASVPGWHHRFEIVPGIVTPGSYDPEFLLEKLSLPDDLSGRRVLDIGASDGYFSLQLRRRGAEVVVVDYRPKELHGFGVMERLTGLRFEYHQANVYEITRERFGTFDVVLFLGLLYHLPDLLKALAIVRSVCSDTMFIESHCAVDLTTAQSAARYNPGSSLNNDFTNFWSPNFSCFRDILHDAAFDVSRQETWGERYFADCRINDEPSRAQKLRVAYGLFDLEAEARKRSDERLARKNEADGSQPAAAPETAVRTPVIQLFANTGGGFDEAAALSAPLSPGRRETILFEQVERLAPSAGSRLRIDPVNEPGMVYIESVRLVRTRDGAVLYAAETPEDFQQVDVDGFLKHETHTGLLLLAFHADPQIYLPPIDFPADEGYALEIVLEAYPMPASIAQRQKRSLLGVSASLETAERERQELAAVRAQLTEARLAAASWEKAFTDTESTLRATHLELGRVNYHREINDRRLEELHAALADREAQLDEARAERKRAASAISELRARSEADAERIQLLQSDAEEFQRFVEKSRTKFSELLSDLRDTHRLNSEYEAQAERDAEHVGRLRDTLAIQTSLRGHLEQCRDRVEQRLDETGRELSWLAQMVSAAPARRAPLVRGIIRDLDATAARSPWPGAGQRARRDLLARELRQRLTRIIKTLAARRDSPEQVAAHLASLGALHRDALRLIEATSADAEQSRSPGVEIEPGRDRSADGRRWRGLIDDAWYLSNYVDVAAAGADPAKHYFSLGAAEGRNPNPLFHTASYLAEYKDVAVSRTNPLVHYVEFGAAEGRKPNFLFDTRWYLRENPDVAASGLNPLQHYILIGAAKGRDPHPLFNTSWYVSRYPESAGWNALQHYLEVGWRHRCSPHPLFDARFYSAKYPDDVRRGCDALQHYLAARGAQRRDPHPDFNTDAYLKQLPDGLDPELTPLEHYVLFGAPRGMRPSTP